MTPATKLTLRVVDVDGTPVKIRATKRRCWTPDDTECCIGVYYHESGDQHCCVFWESLEGLNGKRLARCALAEHRAKKSAPKSE